MEIGSLLSALNQDMQANALFPNRASSASGITAAGGIVAASAGTGGSAAIAAAAAATAALAEAEAANGRIDPATAAAAKAAAASALANALEQGGSSSASWPGGGSSAGPFGGSAGGTPAAAAALAAARAAAAAASSLSPGRAGGLGGAGGAGASGSAASGGAPGTGPGGTASGSGGTGRGVGLSGSGGAGAGGGLSGPGATNTRPNGSGAPADVYHSSGGTHPTPSLLAQSGVKAYTQLLNALSNAGHSEKSAEALTNTLLLTSATLKSAYQQALASLSPQLQAKDWRFSVSNGLLVFAAGNDDVSPQELALLRAAFDEANIEQFANEVANAITTMDSRRSAGADLNSLAWGRFRLDDNNFEQVVDLRSYLTSTAPGSKYSANALSSNLVGPNGFNGGIHTEVPLTLAGMYLGDLVTTRSDFFRPDIPARTDALDRAAEALANAELGTILHGRCSCGEVSFTLENTLDYAYYCHCSRCRARTGSAFAAIGGASIEKLQVTAGNKHLLIEGECSDGYGARCGHCYAFLFTAVRGRQYVHVSLGVLAGTPNRLPDHHIYVGSKAPWYQITDGLPQYDELPLPRR